MTLALSLPTVSERADPTVETRAVYVEEWVEELPFANPSALSESLLNAVSRLNRNPLKPKTRLRLMDYYADAYQSLLHICEDLQAPHSLAAWKKQCQTGKVAENLAVEMSHGYKLIISELAAKRAARGLLAVAVQRAMVFTSVAILHEYDQYRATYATLWNELWSLYEFANAQGFGDEPVRHNGLTDIFTESPARLFKRTVLTSTVDPYRLPGHLVWKIFQLFGEFADAAVLRPDTDAGRQPGVCVVTGDYAAPEHPGAKQKAPHIDSCPPFVLDARLMLQKVEQSRSSSTDSDEAMSRAKAFIEQSLHPEHSARQPRCQARGTVELASGLTTLFYQLSRLQEGAAAPLDEDDITFGVPSNEPTARVYQTDTWELMDQSVGELRIRARALKLLTSVGELVGFRGNDAPAHLRGGVGVIRWLKVMDDGEHQAGVQLLAAAASALRFETAEQTPALGLVLGGQGREGARLVAVRNRCREGQVLNGSLGEREVRLDIGPLATRLDRYDVFQFSCAGYT